MPRRKAILKVVEEDVEEVEKVEEKAVNDQINNDLVMLDQTSIHMLDIYIKGVNSNLGSANLDQLNNYLLNIQKLNANFALTIEHLMNYSDKTTELYVLIEESIKKIQAELTKNKNKNKKINNLDELILNLTNQDQINRLYKILPDNQDYAKVYLQGYTANVDTKKPNLMGTIKILGQYNFKKEEREAYEIKVLQNEPTTFWCSCIDHKLNSAKKHTVCKHIAFVVCKVMKVLEQSFFDTKKLSAEQLQLLLAKFSDKSELWKNKDFVRDIKEITLDTFKNFPTPIDDVCTFCYDQMTDDDKPVALCCPMCNHCFHSECMDIWLENYSKCTVCSSEFWKNYNVVKKGGTINISTKL